MNGQHGVPKSRLPSPIYRMDGGWPGRESTPQVLKSGSACTSFKLCSGMMPASRRIASLAIMLKTLWSFGTQPIPGDKTDQADAHDDPGDQRPPPSLFLFGLRLGGGSRGRFCCLRRLTPDRSRRVEQLVAGICGNDPHLGPGVLRQEQPLFRGLRRFSQGAVILWSTERGAWRGISVETIGRAIAGSIPHSSSINAFRTGAARWTGVVCGGVGGWPPFFGFGAKTLGGD